LLSTGFLKEALLFAADICSVLLHDPGLGDSRPGLWLTVVVASRLRFLRGTWAGHAPATVFPLIDSGRGSMSFTASIITASIFPASVFTS
jgi:hypothetical protein